MLSHLYRFRDMESKHCHIVDVTLRDGALGLGFPFSLEQVKNYLNILNRASVRYAEVGFIKGPGGWKGDKITSPNFHMDAGSINDLSRACPDSSLWRMLDSNNSRITPEDLVPYPNAGLVRIAVKHATLQSTDLELMRICRERHVPYSLNLKYSGLYHLTRIVDTARTAEKHGASVFYIVDTAGTIRPDEIQRAVTEIKNVTAHLHIGFHGHDNLGLAIANTLAARDAGCDFIDASLGGVGAGGGNAVLEALLLLCGISWKHFEALQESYEVLGRAIGAARGQAAFWGLIGCDTSTRERIRLEATHKKVSLFETAWQWRHGSIVHQGEFTTIEKYHDGSASVFARKWAHSRGVPELLKEIRFLTAHVPIQAQKYFPKVLRSANNKEQEWAYYDMPWYEGQTIRHFTTSSRVRKESCLAGIRKSIEVLTDTLHRQHGSASPKDFARQMYHERIIKRFRTRNTSVTPSSLDSHRWQSVQSLSADDLHGLFHTFANAERIVIAGRSYEPPLAIIEKIWRTPAGEILLTQPQESIVLIHGDAHFGNIILREDDTILFVDPNGFLEGGDAAYDIGKLLLSIGWHDAIIDDVMEPINVKIQNSGVHIEGVRRFDSPSARSWTDELRDRVWRDLEERTSDRLRYDKYFLTRSLIVSILHLAALSPTMLLRKPDKAIAFLTEATLGLRACLDFLNKARLTEHFELFHDLFYASVPRHE